MDENGVARPTDVLTRTRTRLSRGFHGEGGRIPKPTAEEFGEITGDHRR
ncbi:hypothetical protein ACIQOW_04610 [Kitasatospora sp. NPDC091335]